MKTQTLLDFCSERRFFLGPLVLVLTLGYFFDWKDRLEAFYDLLDREKNLALQLQEKEQALKKAAPLAAHLQGLEGGKTKQPLLDQLVQAAQITHCVLTALETEFKNKAAAENPSSSPFLIKITLYSHYAGFYHFLETLLRQGLPVEIDSFHMQDKEEQLLIDLQLSAFPSGMILPPSGLPKKTACCKRDPFREAFSGSAQTLPQVEPLQPVNLEQVHYIGYLAQGLQRSALLLLPNSRSIEVTLGSELGAEGWQVQSLDPDSLTLSRASGKIHRRLKRSAS